jgi:thioredoxin 1
MGTIQPLTKQELESNVLQAKGSVVLDFYQASCPPCRALEPRLERVARRYADQVSIYRVDIDRDLSVAEQFGVMSIPTVLVLRSGKEVERLDGLITESQLITAFGRASHV